MDRAVGQPTRTAGSEEYGVRVFRTTEHASGACAKAVRLARSCPKVLVPTLGAAGLAAMLVLSAVAGGSSAAAAPSGRVPAIDRLVDVELHGVTQKLLIQTNDLAHPILLWLHGGPGTSEMLINHHCMSALFDRFTVVHWDQRGTAMSYHPGLEAADITFEKILADALSLTELLKTTYGKRKIVIVGHSFGSILGMHLIDRHPQHYAAYVGVGQVVDERKSREVVRRWLIGKLEAEGDSVGLKNLSDAGHISRAMVRKYHGIYVKDRTMWDVIQESPYYSQAYGRQYERSTGFVQRAMGVDTSRFGTPIFTGIRSVEVPVFFFAGRHDRVPACAPEVIVEYLPQLQAPHKEIVWFEESGHHPNIEEPEKFQRMLIEKVLPLAALS